METQQTIRVEVQKHHLVGNGWSHGSRPEYNSEGKIVGRTLIDRRCPLEEAINEGLKERRYSVYGHTVNDHETNAHYEVPFEQWNQSSVTKLIDDVEKGVHTEFPVIVELELRKSGDAAKPADAPQSEQSSL